MPPDDRQDTVKPDRFRRKIHFFICNAEPAELDCTGFITSNLVMLEGTAPLAIASVTAVLKDLLGNGLIKYSGVTRLGDVTVSVLPPDRITVGADESSQLNLFMYRVTPHTTWRDVPKERGGARNSKNGSRLTLDLHYLLTAYGAQDFHEEILLGAAVHLLNQTPVLTPDIIRKALVPGTSKNGKNLVSPVRAALSASELADQFEEIKVTPQFLGFEEMSKLWSMLQARYRPSVTYEVSAITMMAR